MTNEIPENENATSSTYEKVMVAAREARRLNDRHLISHIEPEEKVTSQAIRRAQRGEVEFDYARAEGDASDEER